MNRFLMDARVKPAHDALASTTPGIMRSEPKPS